MVISLRPGMEMERDVLCKRLVDLQYERNDINFIRNKFRVHGDTVDIYLAYMSDLAIRWSFLGTRSTASLSSTPSPGPSRMCQACGHLPGQPLYRQRRKKGEGTGKDPRRV